MKAHSAK
ncbi:hypothetical protein MTR67_039133 [Solanum verrucosum]|nr:hypothetical protein MTR67_039133 [Solanum verrucosum]